MFSGTLQQWQEDNCIREEPPQFVHRLAEHVYKVFQALERQLGWQHYKRDAECLRDRSNSKRSARAWFLQHQEGLICASIAEAVQKQGFSPATLAHDAVYILADGSERLDIQDMEQHVQRQTAYSLKLQFKDIPDKPELLSAFERADDETAKAIRDVEATLGAFSIRYQKPRYCVFDGNTLQCARKNEFLDQHSCVVERKKLQLWADAAGRAAYKPWSLRGISSMHLFRWGF
jgi:hypothetical protein